MVQFDSLGKVSYSHSIKYGRIYCVCLET